MKSGLGRIPMMHLDVLNNLYKAEYTILCFYIYINFVRFWKIHWTNQFLPYPCYWVLAGNVYLVRHSGDVLEAEGGVATELFHEGGDLYHVLLLPLPTLISLYRMCRGNIGTYPEIWKGAWQKISIRAEISIICCSSPSRPSSPCIGG